MPGLIVVAGEPQAEARARRIARPLLRQPWERLSLSVAADGSVALGYAGERGGLAQDGATGCTLAFEGEIHGPPRVRTGAQAAQELLGLYLRDGATMSPPEGSFTIAVWDSRADELVLLTDRFANQGLYVAREGKVVLAAGELKGLVAGGFPARLDLQGIAESLVYGFAVSDHALLAGIRFVPDATTLVFGAHGERATRRWRYAARPPDEERSRVDERELVEEFARLLDRAVERIVDGRESLALSGGLDSRCLAAALTLRGFSGLAATHARPGSREAALATRVARSAGFRHRVLELEPGFMTRGAPICVWLSDGRKVPLSSHGLAFRSLRHEEGVRALLTGTRGDEGVRLMPLLGSNRGTPGTAAAIHQFSARRTGGHLEPALHPRFADDIQGLAEAAVARAVAGQEGDAQAQLARIRFQDTAIESASTYDDHLVPRSPYLNFELVDFCSRLPYRLRFHGQIQRAYLRRHPALARISTWDQGVPPAVPDALQHAARGAVRLWRRARTRLSSYAPRSLRRFPYLFFADVILGGDGILAVLLEERTLDRRQLHPEVVRRFVRETASGSPAHMSALARLLRLELFQRQFVDGDGAPPEAERATSRSDQT